MSSDENNADTSSPEAEVSGLEGDGLFACQEELLGLIETLSDVIFCAKGRDGRYVAANAAFLRRAGCRSKRDLIGTTSADHFIAELAARYDEQDEVVLSTGRALRDELELIRRANGDLGWYLTTKLPVHETGPNSPIVGLVSVSRDLATPSDERIAIEGLQSVVSHVRGHLGQNLTVGDLAAIAGCSASQLNRRLRRVFGVTATQFLLRVRVDAASELLLLTERPLAEIAAECGFYDQPSFTHRFARLTNTTPAQFRAAHRSEQSH